MKTRLRDLLKNNKLLNIVSNRYNLDKEDRKTLNEMISNQGGGADDGMEYYELDHDKLQNAGVRMAALDNITSSTITDDGLLVAAKNATPYGIGKYIEVNTKIMIPYEDTYINVDEFLNYLVEHTRKEWQYFAKEITAKEYYSLLD